MNLNISDSKSLLSDVGPKTKTLTKSELWVAPSYTSLPALSEDLPNYNFRLGSQNVHWDLKGAYTGEISATMLTELNCTFAIVGHSERRHVFFETDEMIAGRLSAALDAGLFGILCVGETLQQRDQQWTENVIRTQLEQALLLHNKEKLVIAYEPVWAIGTGKTASTSDIEKVHAVIAEMFPGTPILYGGSVTPENFGEILKVPNVNGGLVGGASMKAESLTRLLELADR